MSIGKPHGRPPSFGISRVWGGRRVATSKRGMKFCTIDPCSLFAIQLTPRSRLDCARSPREHRRVAGRKQPHRSGTSFLQPPASNTSESGTDRSSTLPWQLRQKSEGHLTRRKVFGSALGG